MEASRIRDTGFHFSDWLCLRSYARLTELGAAVLLLAGLPGCFTVRGKDGTAHHVVLGFGVISTKESPDGLMTVTKSSVLGVHATNSPGMQLGIGLSKSLVTTVKAGAEDVRAEVVELPGGPISFGKLRVDVQRAVMDDGASSEPKQEQLKEGERVKRKE